MSEEGRPRSDDGRPPLLEVENLVARFAVPRGVVGAFRGRPKLAVRAVDGVSFIVREGELLALVGESGSGKTTTAQSIPTSVKRRWRPKPVGPAS